ncbi:MAG: hypothetical protein JWM95_5594 [Gemmatimonadetes bacterium]|nr:hypothetical protein [Gemmatimonadota bacterium]
MAEEQAPRCAPLNRNSERATSPMKLSQAVFALLCTSTSLAAQATGRIAGIVRNDSGRVLSGADVTLRPTEKRTKTDSAGRFEFGELAPGTYTVRARRLGNDPREAEVQLRADTMARLSLTLKTRRVVLDTVLVVGATCSAVTYEGFLCRRRNNGHGQFLDFTAIDSLDSGYAGLGDVFRNLKGFRVEVDRNGSRRPIATEGWKCLASVVNGREVSRANPLPAQLDEVIAVEIYASPNDAPEAYQRMVWTDTRGRTPSRRCSLVVYWTS